MKINRFARACFGIGLGFSLAGGVACSTHSSHGDLAQNKSAAEAQPRGTGSDRTKENEQRNPAAGGDGAVWGPVVRLRDNTDHFPGTAQRPKPDGGWWVTPIHATLLGDGKVLINGWGRFDFSDCQIHRTRQNGESYLIDPNTVSTGSDRTIEISPIDENPKAGTADVLYCAGNLTLADGRILFVGGARYENLGDKPGELEYGLNYSRLYDPKSKSFSRIEFAPRGSPRKIPGTIEAQPWYEDGMMWYPTTTHLPGGKVLVIGGFNRSCADGTCNNRDIEIFDPAVLEHEPASGVARTPWMTVLAHDQAPKDTYDLGIKDYAHTILLYQPMSSALGGGVKREVITMGWPGKVAALSLNPKVDPAHRIYVGPLNSATSDSANEASGAVLGASSSATSGRSPVSFQRPGGAAAWDSSAALVGTGEILIVGGGSNPRAEAQRIDLFNPQTGTWRSFNTGITRHNPATTLLPDGKVLIINGEPGDDVANAIGDLHRPQIFDPFTGILTTLDAWPDLTIADRGYHSFSLLLKDARILLGGGMVTLAQVGCERPDLRILNLPYLSQGPRPILSAKHEGQTIDLNQTFEIEHSGAEIRDVRGVVLMALGSETHSFDQAQRYVPLQFKKLKSGRLRVLAPANSTLAPEGEYTMYLVSETGVPSVGRLIHLR